MSENTARLKLPFIAAAQAQKHVTHNEALLALDAIIHAAVEDKDLAAPPADPQEGQAWLVAASASGAWAGHEGEMAVWSDGVWRFHAPAAGWIVLVRDENRLIVYNGVLWRDFGEMLGALANLDKLGVNTAADDTNRLAAKSDAILFSHDDVTPGTGDIRVKLNKKQSGKTASFLFQDNWSGRAEIGLAGTDDFHVKVSTNGGSWIDAIRISAGANDVKFAVPARDSFRIRGSRASLDLEDRAGVAQRTAKLILNPKFGNAIRFGHLGLALQDFDETASPPAHTGPVLGIGFSVYSLTPYFWDRNGQQSDILTAHHARVASHAVSALPSASASGAGSLIFVNDEAGGPTLAFSDGTDWRRVQDRAVVS